MSPLITITFVMSMLHGIGGMFLISLPVATPLSDPSESATL